jgi:hypothetical protein
LCTHLHMKHRHIIIHCIAKCDYCPSNLYLLLFVFGSSFYSLLHLLILPTHQLKLWHINWDLKNYNLRKKDWLRFVCWILFCGLNCVTATIRFCFIRCLSSNTTKGPEREKERKSKQILVNKMWDKCNCSSYISLASHACIYVHVCTYTESYKYLIVTVLMSFWWLLEEKRQGNSEYV